MAITKDQYNHILARLATLEDELYDARDARAAGSNQSKQEREAWQKLNTADTNQPLTDAVERELAKLPKLQEPEYKKHIDEFYIALTRKLHLGYVEYGDESFGRKPSALVNEIKEEAIDIAGWAMILWVRLNNLEQSCIDLEDAPPKKQ